MQMLVPDQWLGEQIERTAYKVNCTPDLLKADPADLDAALQPLQAESVFAYAKVSVDDLAAVHFLQRRGFLLVDTSTTFDKPFNADQPISGNSLIRFAVDADREQVAAVAGSSFVYSRFHQDPFISNTIADDLKAQWAANFFNGQRGDAMIVAEKEGQVCGFLQLLYRPDHLVIDLIAVLGAARRQQVAQDMIAYAGQHCPAVDQMVVTTQIANVPSMRLYEKIGFRIHAAQYIFHYHH